MSLLMRFCLCVSLLLYVYSIDAQYISEFSYDNVGVDTNEFVELSLPESDLPILNTYQISLYNGANGKAYDSVRASNLPDPYCINGECYIVWTPRTIQQGPDGIALSRGQRLIEFISYEGIFLATEGIANSRESIDIGVSQTNSSPESESLAKHGQGWELVAENTKGFNNIGFPPASFKADVRLHQKSFIGQKMISDVIVWPVNCNAYQYTIWYSADGIELYRGNSFNPKTHPFYEQPAAGESILYAVEVCFQEGERIFSEPVKIEYEWLDFIGASSIGCPYIFEFWSDIDVSNQAILVNGADIELSLDQLDGNYKAIAKPFQNENLLGFEVVGIFSEGDSIKVWNSINELVFEYPNRSKALVPNLCPSTCQQSSNQASLHITIGSQADVIGWELRDATQKRVAFRNPGYFKNFKRGDTIVEPISFEVCEPYTFTLLNAIDESWGNNAWFIRSAKSNRDTILKQATDMYARKRSHCFTLPCLPEAKDSILYTSTCSISFQPQLISPIICYPYFQHATGTIEQFLTIEKATGEMLALGSSLHSISLPAGANKLHYTLKYPDRQVVEFVKTIIILPDNERVICNDELIISSRDIDQRDSCFFTVNPDQFLENIGTCTDLYEPIFYLNGEEISNFSSENYGQKLAYKIFVKGTDLERCAGFFRLIDVSKPALSVNNYTINCNHPAGFNERFIERLFFNALVGSTDSIKGGEIDEPSMLSFPIKGVGCGDLGEVVKDFKLRLRMTHSDVEDLQITLKSPQGEQFILMDYGTCLDRRGQNINVSFDAKGGVSIDQACRNNVPALDGVYTAHESISEFIDQDFSNLEGDWEVIIKDNDSNTVEGAGEGLVRLVQLQIIKGFPELFTTSDCSNVDVEVVSELLKGECGENLFIERQIVALDAFGNETKDIQKTFLNIPSLEGISFDNLQSQFELTSSTPKPSEIPIGIGGFPKNACNDIKPTQNDICNIAITSTDRLIPTCGKTFVIERAWTFINLCNAAEKELVQTIEFVDTQAPRVVFESDTLFLDESCKATFCTDAISISDLNAVYRQTIMHKGNLLNFEIEDSIDGVSNGDALFIEVEDVCQNIKRDTLFVLGIDNQAPNLACIDRKVINLQVDSFFLKPSDILINITDCAPTNSKISVLEGCKAGYFMDSLLLGCCSTPYLIEAEVEDTSGNRNVCWSVVQVTNEADCGAPRIVLEARVELYGNPLPGVSFENNNQKGTTDDKGTFLLSFAQKGIQRIQLSKEEFDRRGLNSFDLLQLQLHLLEKKRLLGQQLLAADLDKSSHIGLLDLLLLQKKILNQPVKPSIDWRFFEKETSKELANNYFIDIQRDTTIFIEALRVGDVDKSYFLE